MPPQLSSAMQGVSRSWSVGFIDPSVPGVDSGSACSSEVTEKTTVAKVRSARRPMPRKQTLDADV